MRHLLRGNGDDGLRPISTTEGFATEGTVPRQLSKLPATGPTHHEDYKSRFEVFRRGATLHIRGSRNRTPRGQPNLAAPAATRDRANLGGLADLRHSEPSIEHVRQ